VRVFVIFFDPILFEFVGFFRVVGYPDLSLNQTTRGRGRPRHTAQ
jgi:hypothetical protein